MTVLFNETRLLDKVAYGSQFGQEFNTRIVQLRSGREKRNANWSLPLGRYSVLFQAIRPEDHGLVRGAHMACMGSLIAFRFKDHSDYTAEDEALGTGTGASQDLQLIKAYDFGPVTLTRNIVKPVSGTVTIYVNGVPSAAVIDYTTGIVTITAASGAAITWTGEFDVPVRFEADRLDCDPVARQNNLFYLSANVDLTEVRL